MKLRKHILFAVLFILVQGVTFAVTWFGFGYRYGSAQEARLSVLSEAILALMVLVYIRRYASWREAGYGEFSWRRLLWIAPLLLPAVLYAVYFLGKIASAGPSAQQLLGLAAVGVMTLLVGFAEETTFRGILLRGELAAGRNVFVAMIVSAVGFSLLHSVNVLGGLPASEVASQMFSTLMVGLCFAPLALLVGNLIPLVIWHFLWDFITLAPTQVPGLTLTPGPFEILRVSITPLQYVMTVIGWAAVFMLWRRGRFAQRSTHPSAGGAARQRRDTDDNFVAT